MASSMSINLIRGRKPHVLDQFVNWALTIGRGVVILTEVIALGAFLYRFGLDRQLIDLHDKITQEQSIVNLLKTNEDTYRNLQNRLSLAKSVISSQQKSARLYTDILAMFTPDLSLKTLIIDANTVKISVDAPTVVSLSTLINHLKSYPSITSVSIDKIENKTSIGIIDTSITAILGSTQQ